MRQSIKQEIFVIWFFFKFQVLRDQTRSNNVHWIAAPECGRQDYVTQAAYIAATISKLTADYCYRISRYLEFFFHVKHPLHNREKFRPQIRTVLNFRYKHLFHPLLFISSPTLNLRSIVDKHVKGNNVSPCSTQPHSHPCVLEHKTTYRYPTAYNFPRLCCPAVFIGCKQEGG